MSRMAILLAVTGILVVGGCAVILVSMHGGDGTSAAVATRAAAPSDADKRRRAERFFGGDPNRDVRGGQELKPKW